MATSYSDYSGGRSGGDGGDYGAWQQSYLAQQEDQRRLMEEEMRRQQEEEARRAAEEQARAEAEARAQAEQQAQQSQPPQPDQDRSLGSMMQPPPQAPNPYDPGQVQPPSEGFDQRQTQPMPPPAGMPEAPREPVQPPPQAPAPYVHDPNRDFSVNPLTGAELEAFRAAGGNTQVEGAMSYHGGSAFPVGTQTPDRDTSEMDLDQFNQAVRGSELYQQFIDQRGLRGQNGAVIEWNEDDRNAWERALEQHGVSVPGGMKVDNAGNINQKNRLARNIAIIAAIGAGTVLTAGALGAFSGAAAAVAPPAAGAASMSMMPHVITGLAGLGTAYMGSRAQGQADNRAAEAQEAGMASSERTITAQMQFEREARAQDRADADRRWEAEQEFARQQWAASEDERMFRRQLLLEDRAGRGGGGGVSYGGGPSEADLRKQRAISNLDALLRQGTPGLPGSGGYVPATQAGPTGRG